MSDPLSIYAKEKEVTDKDIVFLGCSFTAGCGLNNITHRYSTLVSTFFNKNEINCAKGGSSNYHSFKQFNSLNFVDKGTIVVFQITQLARIPYYEPKTNSFNDLVLSHTHHKKLQHFLEAFDDYYLVNDLLTRLKLVIQFSREKKLKLVIWGIANISNNEILKKQFEDYLQEFPEFIHLDDRLNTPTSYRVDNASDGTHELGTGHPGPESNKLIAHTLINHINKLYP